MDRNTKLYTQIEIDAWAKYRKKINVQNSILMKLRYMDYLEKNSKITIIKMLYKLKKMIHEQNENVDRGTEYTKEPNKFWIQRIQ